MYLEYGKIYDRLTELTQLGKLIFIAAQPKVAAWDLDVIEQNMVGESSRKIHSVDMAITGSKATEFGNSGIFKIVKNRRGDAGESIGYIRLNNGRFKYMERALFNSLRNTDTRSWSEGQVDEAKYTYEQSQSGIRGNSMNYASGGASTMNNPFGNKRP